MIAQLDNKVISSFLLWLDNTILTKGQAYTNWSSKFYKVSSPLTNYYTYALPFKQINADQSIAGANIMSGIYINGNFITAGQSGLLGINYNQGHVYFSQNVDNEILSGDYSVKDYSMALTSEPEEKLLFETKYFVKPKTSYQITGLAPSSITYPIMFVKNEGSENIPFAFGGTDTTEFYVRAVIISDSQFSLDAASSILRDKVRTFIPIIEPNEMPFNNYGDVNNNYYNYQELTQNKTNSIFISKVSNSRVSYRSVIMNELKDLNPGIFPSIIDFDLQIVRNPRSE